MDNICNCECDNCKDNNCDECICCGYCNICELCITNDGEYDIVDIDSDTDIIELTKNNINIEPCIHGYNVQIIAPCCNNVYSCILCHNIKENHDINKNKIREFVCIKCFKQQDKTEKCINCGMKFDICLNCLENHDINIKLCVQCNKCHDTKYNCKDYIYKENKCYVCLNIINKEEESAILLCGHIIHEDCKNYLLKNTYKCPVCNKSMRNMSEEFFQMDMEIEKNKMPKTMIHKIKIHCNDCLTNSEVNYHYVGLKCYKCKSYNTNKL